MSNRGSIHFLAQINRFKMKLILLLLIIILINLSNGLPTEMDTDEDVSNDRLSRLPSDLIADTLSFLDKHALDDSLTASIPAKKKMRLDYSYDSEHSILGSNEHFIALEEFVLPPPEFNLYYVHACNDTFHAIETAHPVVNLNHLVVVHIKFCNDVHGQPGLDRLIIDQFLLLAE